PPARCRRRPRRRSAARSRGPPAGRPAAGRRGDRKSTRLNSSHVSNSYAVFCLKKKISRTRSYARIGDRSSLPRADDYTSGLLPASILSHQLPPPLFHSHHTLLHPRLGFFFVALPRRPLTSPPFPYTTLFRSRLRLAVDVVRGEGPRREVGDLRQVDRQLVVGDRVRGALVVVDDGERLAPVALTGEEPVAQTVLGGRLRESLGLEPGQRGRLRLGDRRPVEVDLVVRGVDLRPVARVDGVLIVVRRRLHGPDVRQAEGLREVPVARILPGHAHDGARAVVHEDVVRAEHRQPRAGRGILHVRAGE